MTTSATRTAIGALLGAALASTAATAADVNLPGTMAWSAYGLNSSGYAQSVAIGKGLKEKYGVNLRVIPGKNDISRMAPLKTGQVQASNTGVGAYFAQEGVFEFAGRDWGPQALRVIMTSKGSANLAVGVAADIGVKTLADLKGKRVAWVKGAPALNHNVTAMLACADLGWDDVEKVEFAGFGASWTGILNDQADAAFSITVSGAPKQVAASPRGVVWPEQPHDDDGCWQRMLAIAPYFTKNVATKGSNISADKPHVGMAYPYPVLTVYADAGDDLAYGMAKGISESFELFKDGAPGADGWAMTNQTFAWAVPYHDGAVAYFKEIGVWTDAMQAHNDALIARQTVLIDAWNGYVGSAPSDDDAFEAGWIEARAAALAKAGMDVIFE